SLWILSQPIVGRPTLYSLRASSDVVSLAPYELRELCLELTPRDVVHYDFQAEQPVEFDIHYHDGLRIRFPVKLRETTGQEGDFMAGLDQTYCLSWFNRSLTEISLEYHTDR
ncbi:MAG: hypothetical protein VCB77_07815, partial [Alphaproteobacteria bacterium]